MVTLGVVAVIREIKDILRDTLRIHELHTVLLCSD